VHKCRKQWIEYTDRSEADAQRVHQQCAHEIRQDDTATAPCDLKRLGKQQQIITQQHDIGTLASYIRSRTHGDSNRGLNQGRSNVYTITEHRNFLSLGNEGFHTIHFVRGKTTGLFERMLLFTISGRPTTNLINAGIEWTSIHRLSRNRIELIELSREIGACFVVALHGVVESPLCVKELDE
jgi:hypothetical protein